MASPSDKETMERLQALAKEQACRTVDSLGACGQIDPKVLEAATLAAAQAGINGFPLVEDAGLSGWVSGIQAAAASQILSDKARYERLRSEIAASTVPGIALTPAVAPIAVVGAIVPSIIAWLVSDEPVAIGSENVDSRKSLPDEVVAFARDSIDEQAVATDIEEVQSTGGRILSDFIYELEQEATTSE